MCYSIAEKVLSIPMHSTEFIAGTHNLQYY